MPKTRIALRVIGTDTYLKDINDSRTTVKTTTVLSQARTWQDGLNFYTNVLPYYLADVHNLEPIRVIVEPSIVGVATMSDDAIASLEQRIEEEDTLEKLANKCHTIGEMGQKKYRRWQKLKTENEDLRKLRDSLAEKAL